MLHSLYFKEQSYSLCTRVSYTGNTACYCCVGVTATAGIVCISASMNASFCLSRCIYRGSYAGTRSILPPYHAGSVVVGPLFPHTARGRLEHKKATYVGNVASCFCGTTAVGKHTMQQVLLYHTICRTLCSGYSCSCCKRHKQQLVRL